MYCLKFWDLGLIWKFFGVKLEVTVKSFNKILNNKNRIISETKFIINCKCKKD